MEYKKSLTDVEEPFAHFHEMVHTLLQEWNIPGLSIAIVKNDQLLFAQGYGVRDTAARQPMNAQTLVGVGSVTKAFTAAALALLVDEEKLHWDDPVCHYLPDFTLYDSYVTKNLTIRDLLCARSGLVGGDIMRFGDVHSQGDILYRLRYLKPDAGFRTTQGAYTFMFLIAGQIVEAITGQKWETFVQARILSPLKMMDSHLSLAPLASLPNKIVSYRWLVNENVPMPWYDMANIASAGSLITNVIDLAQWVKLHLNMGCYEQQRLLSEKTLSEMHTPQIVLPPEIAGVRNPETHFVSYGLGLSLYDYRGRKIIEHGGACIEGMNALITMMPEHQLGLIFLSNAEQGRYLVHVLKFLLLDYYLAAPVSDWNALYLQRWQQDEARLEEAIAQTRRKLLLEQNPTMNPSFPLDRYNGTYENAYFGRITIAKDGTQLSLHYGILSADLEHLCADAFRVSWHLPLRGDDTLTFHLDPQGQIQLCTLSRFGDFRSLATSLS